MDLTKLMVVTDSQLAQYQKCLCENNNGDFDVVYYKHLGAILYHTVQMQQEVINKLQKQLMSIRNNIHAIDHSLYHENEFDKTCTAFQYPSSSHSNEKLDVINANSEETSSTSSFDSDSNDDSANNKQLDNANALKNDVKYTDSCQVLNVESKVADDKFVLSSDEAINRNNSTDTLKKPFSPFSENNGICGFMETGNRTVHRDDHLEITSKNACALSTPNDDAYTSMSDSSSNLDDNNSNAEICLAHDENAMKKNDADKTFSPMNNTVDICKILSLFSENTITQELAYKVKEALLSENDSLKAAITANGNENTIKQNAVIESTKDMFKKTCPVTTSLLENGVSDSEILPKITGVESKPSLENLCSDFLSKNSSTEKKKSNSKRKLVIDDYSNDDVTCQKHSQPTEFNNVEEQSNKFIKLSKNVNNQPTTRAKITAANKMYNEKNLSNSKILAETGDNESNYNNTDEENRRWIYDKLGSGYPVNADYRKLVIDDYSNDDVTCQKHSQPTEFNNVEEQSNKFIKLSKNVNNQPTTRAKITAANKMYNEKNLSNSKILAETGDNESNYNNTDEENRRWIYDKLGSGYPVNADYNNPEPFEMIVPDGPEKFLKNRQFMSMKMKIINDSRTNYFNHSALLDKNNKTRNKSNNNKNINRVSSQIIE